MSRPGFVVIAALSTACAATGVVETQPAQLGDLAYDVPAGWTHRDGKTRRQISTEWLPSDNERKESLEVIQTEVSASVLRGGPEELKNLLDHAQPVGGRPSVVARSALTSPNGLVGRQIEVDFTPPGTGQVYRRVHAVLIDGKKLIHVIYTAKDPEPDAVSIVVSSIHHGGA